MVASLFILLFVCTFHTVKRIRSTIPVPLLFFFLILAYAYMFSKFTEIGLKAGKQELLVFTKLYK